MSSTVVRFKDISSFNRWDFEYFDPEYTHVINQIKNSGWDVQSLGNIVTNLTDGQHGYLEHLPEGVLLLRTTNIFENEINLDDTRYIAPQVHAKLKRSQLKPGDVLLTTIGSIGIAAVVDDSLGEANINQNLVKITPKPEINPTYLALFLNSTSGRIQTARTASKSVVPIINYARLKDILVPLPPRSIQDSIADSMGDVYKSRNEKLATADSLLRRVEVHIYEALEMSPERVKEEKLFIKQISDLNAGRFDVAYNMGFHKFDPYSDRVVPIKSVATVAKETKDPSSEPDKVFKYIDISNINVLLGEVEKVTDVLGADAPSRARQVVHTEDIIVSTVRPTRGAIAMIPREMDGCICSTGFVVLRAKDEVIPAYLHTVLRLSTTLEQFARRATGSSYPAILEDDIKETLIPYADEKVQDRIAIEVTGLRIQAKRLRKEAEVFVNAAKANIERIILGEEKK